MPLCQIARAESKRARHGRERDLSDSPPESAAARVSFQLRTTINRWVRHSITVEAGLQVNHPFLFSLKRFEYEALIKQFGGQVNTCIMDQLHRCYWHQEGKLQYSGVNSQHP